MTRQESRSAFHLKNARLLGKTLSLWRMHFPAIVAVATVAAAFSLVSGLSVSPPRALAQQEVTTQECPGLAEAMKKLQEAEREAAKALQEVEKAEEALDEAGKRMQEALEMILENIPEASNELTAKNLEVTGAENDAAAANKAVVQAAAKYMYAPSPQTEGNVGSAVKAAKDAANNADSAKASRDQLKDDLVRRYSKKTWDDYHQKEGELAEARLNLKHKSEAVDEAEQQVEEAKKRCRKFRFPFPHPPWRFFRKAIWPSDRFGHGGYEETNTNVDGQLMLAREFDQNVRLRQTTEYSYSQQTKQRVGTLTTYYYPDGKSPASSVIEKFGQDGHQTYFETRHYDKNHRQTGGYRNQGDTHRAWAYDPDTGQWVVASAGVTVQASQQERQYQDMLQRWEEDWNRAHPPGSTSEEKKPPMVTRELGLVMPIGRPREAISGTVVDNPKQYENMPGLRVVTFNARVPLDAAATGSLQGVVLETPDGRTVPAEDRRVTAQIPALTAMLTFVVRQLDEPKSRVQCDFPIDHARNLTNNDTPSRWLLELDRRRAEEQRRVGPGVTQKKPLRFDTSPVEVSSAEQVFHGAFSGNLNRTYIRVDGIPARVDAETEEAAYWRLPENISPGRHHIVLEEQGQSFGFDVFVMALEMSADQRELLKGQSTRYHVRLILGQGMSDSAWERAAVPSDVVDFNQMEKTLRGFHRPASGEPGQILFMLTNSTPQTITVPDLPGGVRFFRLTRHEFINGVWTHDGTIQSIHGGGFGLNGVAVAFFEPVLGQPLVDEGMAATGETVSITPEEAKRQAAYDRLQAKELALARALAKARKKWIEGAKSAGEDIYKEWEDAERETAEAKGVMQEQTTKDGMEAAIKRWEKALKRLEEAKKKVFEGMKEKERQAWLEADKEANEAEKERDKAYEDYQKTVPKQ